MLRKLDDLASQAAAQKMQSSMIFSPYVLQIESGQIEANFLDFLRTLGQPMRNKCVSSQQQHMKRSLYWSDASSEMMFYVPSAAASGSNQLPTANGGTFKR